MLCFRKKLSNRRVQEDHPEWEGERRQDDEHDEQTARRVDRMITLTAEEGSGLQTNSAKGELEETTKKILYCKWVEITGRIAVR